jgi:5'-3' exonuclease
MADGITPNVRDESVFLEKFDTLFYKHITTLIKKYNASIQTTILAKDCHRCNIWRHKLIDKYKDTRETSNAISDIFKHVFKNTLAICPYQIVSHQYLEADDIIASLVKKDNGANDIVIITNDNDYVQLSAPNVKIYNMQGKDVVERVKMDPQLYLLTKIIMGDKSDNIQAIAKGVGPVRARNLAENPELLDEFLKNNPEANNRFLTNKTIIDFNSIPKELINQIVVCQPVQNLNMKNT